MRVLLVLLALGLAFSLDAKAGVLASLGTNLSFEHDNDGRNYEVRQPLAMRGGYRFRLADLYLEYSRFKSSQEVSVVRVSREHTEWLAWARHVFHPRWTVAPYAAFGIGVQYDDVETSFQGENASEAGTPDSMAAFAGGIRVSLAERLNLELEGRAGFSKSFAPNPLLGAGFYIGWIF